MTMEEKDINLPKAANTMESNVEAAESRHWVADMFPPTYSLQEEDLGSSNVINAAPKMSIFEQLAKKVSPLDESSLQNVYERVWLMIHLKHEEKKKREEAKKELESKEAAKAEKLKRQKARKEFLHKQSMGPQTLTDALHKDVVPPVVDLEQLDIDEPSIWNSEEISILRKVFKKTREENHKMKAELYTLKADFDKMRRQSKKQVRTLEVKATSLENAVKANERLRIIVESLKKDIKKAEANIDFLHQQILDGRESQGKLTKETHHFRIELDRERLAQQKMEQDLILQQQHLKRNLELKEERLKMQHEREVTKLKNIIEDLQDQLLQERDSHKRSKRGLDHLRTHFASVLMADVEDAKTSGPVTKDQLSQWTHY